MLKKKDLQQLLIKENAFWSYQVDVDQEIDDEVLIEKTLIYLDLDEINALFELYPYQQLKKVWQERVLSQEPRYHNLNLFLGRYYFDK